MPLLARWTIRTKVFAAFGVVFAATLGLGVLAIDRLGAVNHEAAEVRDNWLPSVQIVAQLTINAERHRTNVGYHVMGATEADHAKAVADLQGLVDQLGRDRAAYEPLITPGEERHLAQQFDQQWADYLAVAKQVLALSSRREVAQAQELYRGAMRAAFQKARTTLAEDMDLNRRGG